MKEYILQRKIARVIAIIAQRAGISQEQALCDFYENKVYDMLHNSATEMQLMSDDYIADEYFIRKNRNNKKNKKTENTFEL